MSVFYKYNQDLYSTAVQPNLTMNDHLIFKTTSRPAQHLIDTRTNQLGYLSGQNK